MTIDNRIIEGLSSLLDAAGLICPEKIPPPEVTATDVEVVHLLEAVIERSGVRGLEYYDDFNEWTEWGDFLDNPSVDLIKRLLEKGENPFVGYTQCLSGVDYEYIAEWLGGCWGGVDPPYFSVAAMMSKVAQLPLLMDDISEDYDHESVFCDADISALGMSPYIRLKDENWSYQNVCSSPLRAYLADCLPFVYDSNPWMETNPFLGLLDRPMMNDWATISVRWQDVARLIELHKKAQLVWASLPNIIELRNPDWVFDQVVQSFAITEPEMNSDGEGANGY